MGVNIAILIPSHTFDAIVLMPSHTADKVSVIVIKISSVGSWTGSQASEKNTMIGENITGAVSTTSFHFSTIASHISIAISLIDSHSSAKNTLTPFHNSTKNVTVLSHTSPSISQIAI